MFAGEHDSNKYRKFIGERARDEKYKNNIKLLIEDALEELQKTNPEALNKVAD